MVQRDNRYALVFSVTGAFGKGTGHHADLKAGLLAELKHRVDCAASGGIYSFDMTGEIVWTVAMPSNW